MLPLICVYVYGDVLFIDFNTYYWCVFVCVIKLLDLVVIEMLQ